MRIMSEVGRRSLSRSSPPYCVHECDALSIRPSGGGHDDTRHRRLDALWRASPRQRLEVPWGGGGGGGGGGLSLRFGGMHKGSAYVQYLWPVCMKGKQSP